MKSFGKYTKVSDSIPTCPPVKDSNEAVKTSTPASQDAREAGNAGKSETSQFPENEQHISPCALSENEQQQASPLTETPITATAGNSVASVQFSHAKDHGLEIVPIAQFQKSSSKDQSQLSGVASNEHLQEQASPLTEISVASVQFSHAKDHGLEIVPNTQFQKSSSKDQAQLSGVASNEHLQEQASQTAGQLNAATASNSISSVQFSHAKDHFLGIVKNDKFQESSSKDQCQQSRVASNKQIKKHALQTDKKPNAAKTGNSVASVRFYDAKDHWLGIVRKYNFQESSSKSQSQQSLVGLSEHKQGHASQTKEKPNAATAGNFISSVHFSDAKHYWVGIIKNSEFQKSSSKDQSQQSHVASSEHELEQASQTKEKPNAAKAENSVASARFSDTKDYWFGMITKNQFQKSSYKDQSLKSRVASIKYEQRHASQIAEITSAATAKTSVTSVQFSNAKKYWLGIVQNDKFQKSSSNDQLQQSRVAFNENEEEQEQASEATEKHNTAKAENSIALASVYCSDHQDDLLGEIKNDQFQKSEEIKYSYLPMLDYFTGVHVPIDAKDYLIDGIHIPPDLHSKAVEAMMKFDFMTSLNLVKDVAVEANHETYHMPKKPEDNTSVKSQVSNKYYLLKFALATTRIVKLPQF